MGLILPALAGKEFAGNLAERGSRVACKGILPALIELGGLTRTGGMVVIVLLVFPVLLKRCVPTG